MKGESSAEKNKINGQVERLGLLYSVCKAVTID
jgi:hypothetical protein